jgi:hypothetical protein
MAIGDLLSKIKGNPIEKLTLRQLREEEIRLNNQLDGIRKEIDTNEKEKKKQFRDGVGADLLKKKMLMQEMKALDMEAKLNLRRFTTSHQQLRFIKNMLIVKTYEKQLKEKGIWKKLTNIPREQLESTLIRISLDGKDFDSVLDELNKPFEMEVAEADREMSEEDKEIMKAWGDVESGTLEPEKAAEKFSVSRRLTEEEKT